MSKQGMKVALQRGDVLPSFDCQEAAQEALFKQRDESLELLSHLSRSQTLFKNDYSPASLKDLEAWYFELQADRGFEKLEVQRSTFEHCMAMYYGSVAVKNAEEAAWIVEPYPFVRGKYEIGISRGIMSEMLTCGCNDLFQRPNNKGHNSLYRDYKRWYGSAQRK